jgi:flagellar basal body P-ring formation protein FlgA
VLLRQLEPVWLIAKGNPVVLVATAGGLAVSAPAEALEDGGMGDVIRVLNLSSQREIKAVVTGKNSVTAQTNMR